VQVEADWWARGIAIAGWATAAAALGWNILSWRRQGPVIKVRAVCSGRGDDMKVSCSVRNQGRFDAHIERISVGWAASPASGQTRGAVIVLGLTPEHIEGVTVAFPLAAQTGKEFTVVGIAKFDPGLSAALHDRRDASVAVLTASGKWARGRVRYA
jgi:hypothetical protein